MGIRTKFESLARAGTLAIGILPPGVPERGVGGPLDSFGLGKDKGESLLRYRFLPKGHKGSVREGEVYTAEEKNSPTANQHFQRCLDITNVQRNNHADVSDLGCSFLCGGLSPYKIYLADGTGTAAGTGTSTGNGATCWQRHDLQDILG